MSQDHLFVNKVSAAVIGGTLFIMGVSILSEAFFPEHHGEELAYSTEIVTAASGPVEEVAGPSLAMLMASADPDKGKRAFAACKSCHSIDKGGKNGTGPNLYGVLGRAVGGADGFKYSSAVADHGGSWSFELFDHWLASPKVAIPGNKMSYAGMRKAPKRADLMAYLNTLSDAPMDLPMDAAEEVVEVEEAATH